MIISQTPLRISLLGGGTDFKEYYLKDEGFVLSTAIDKYVFVIIKERFDDFIYVNYSDRERVKYVDEIKHDLVREAMKKTEISNGVEITMFADIPSEGSGLGSSSSLCVGLLNAMYHYKGIQVPTEQLARESCEIEIEVCKKPIGKQDQYIAAYGGLSTFTFVPNEEVKTERISLVNDSLRHLGSNLLLFFTGKTRQSSDILAEQKNRTANGDNFEYLKEIKNLAVRGLNSIKNMDYNNIGELLNKNWELKKLLSSRIETEDISGMHSKCINAGALGAKISGAGGGGFMLVYCEREKQNRLREAMKEYKEMPFMLEQHGSKIIFNYRRYSWK